MLGGGGKEAAPPRGLALPFRPLWAVGTCIGNFGFMLSITLFLLGSDRVPDSVPLEWMLVSGFVLSSLFVLFAIWRIRAGLRMPVPSPATAG